MKTEHYNRIDKTKSEYERAGRTGYKIIGEDVEEGFKEFVRSKLVKEKEFVAKELMMRNPQRDDSLSDVED